MDREHIKLKRYTGLLAVEKRTDYRQILERILVLKNAQNLQVTGVLPIWLKFVRNVFGFTLAVKLIEGRTENEQILAVYEDIKEESVEFTGSIILGLNDGLIELTGVLVGFSFVFNRLDLIALSGLITGISASMSMASSAYMQARHEVGKHPAKAAAYTGIAYGIVVLMLVSPYLLMSSVYSALVAMFVIIFAILAAVSYYTAVLFDRRFSNQFGEIVFFSMGVAFVSFIIGNAFRHFTGIEV